MSKIIEELISHTLTLGIIELWSSNGVVDELKGFPVTLALEHVVHLFLSAFIAVSHDPSVEANHPDLLEHEFDLLSGVVVDHLSDVVDGDSFTASVLSTLSLEMISDGIDEFSEILTYWEVDKDILEE